MEHLSKEEKNKIHGILRNKGDYLFFEDNDLFLMENNVAKKINFISLKPDDDWENIEFGNDYYILSFDLKIDDLTEAIGNKILNFLNELKSRKINFRVSRALPRNIFGTRSITAFNEFKIPNSCRDCLELYKITERGGTILCNGEILPIFGFTRKGREQMYNYLKICFGEKIIIKNQNTRFDFKLIDNLNCTNQKRKIENKIINVDFSAYWISRIGWKPDRKLFDVLLKYTDLLSNGTVLDNGGAHGRDSFLIKKLGFDVVLTDINNIFFKYTKEKQKELGIYFPLIVSDSRLLPFKDESFAGVYSGGVMHHEMDIEDVKRYLKESCRVLMRGGIFFGNVWAYWEFGAPPEPHLLQIRDQDKFECLLKEASFNILDITEFTAIFESHKHGWYFVCFKPGK